MKAMILCAGLGSRLSPLTNVVPKPFVPVGSKPIIAHIIDRLIEADVNEIIINTQYLHEYFLKYLSHFNNFNVKITVIKENELSGDAGGLKKAEFYFTDEENFFVLSGDDLTNINLNKLKDLHINQNSILSMPVIEVEDTSRFGIIEIQNNEIISFVEKPKANESKSNLANTSIYICNKKIFKYIPSDCFYSFGNDLIPELLKYKMKLSAYKTDEYCKDIGTLSSYKESNFDILKKIKNIKIDTYYNLEENLLYHESLNNKGSLKGQNIIGKNVNIGKNSTVYNSIIWDNVTIGENCIVTDCILGYNICIPNGTHIYNASCVKL